MVIPDDVLPANMSESSTSSGGEFYSKPLEETAGIGISGRAKGVFVKTYEWVSSVADGLMSAPIEPTINSVATLATAGLAYCLATIPHVEVQIETFADGEKDE